MGLKNKSLKSIQNIPKRVKDGIRYKSAQA